MANESLNMYDDLSKLISNEEYFTGNSVLEILKKYSSMISVFDMMEFSSQVIKENRYVQESYREDCQKSYIESFLLRVKEISKDENDYRQTIDSKSLSKAIEVINARFEKEEDESKVSLIFYMSSIYATFILEESIHPVGTPFPGSLKVELEDGTFYCPVKEANMDTPNAVCRMCLAEQLDF